MLTDERPIVAPETSAEGLAPVPSDPGAAPRPRWRRRWRIAAAFLALFLILFAYLAVTAPLSKSLKPIAPPAITLLSSDGTPIARKGAITDTPIAVAELPAHVPAAFLAIEDRRFYNHMGIDPIGIVRAAVRNTMAGGVREGGSTITQQLAKLAFLSSERTATRKLQEVILAFWLEAWLSKDEILSRYLSSVYFGDNVYGLRAAAHHYFSRDPADLTVGQAAMLAGLMKAPSRLAPTSNLAGARERAKVVIGAMVETGALTKAEAASLGPVRLRLGPSEDLPSGTYFADWAFPQARAGTEAAYGEQTVRTTLDDRLQKMAVQAVRRAGLGKAQVALVAMRPNGEVVAMIGGKSYKASPFNRATQARRQPGSTFKLFVYLAALRTGMTPDSMVEDAPLTIGDWSPANSDGHYRGLITLREAFAKSSNVAAVRLSETVGRDKVIRAARDLGVTSELTSSPSIALGTSGVSLMEMVAAYAAVAGDSYPVKPHALPGAAEEGWFQALRSTVRRFQDRSTRPMLLDLLYASANQGTGRAASLRVKTYGKTGTTQDNRDAIFIGFAGDLVTGVWVGNDDNSPLRGVQGGGLPAQIWRDFMTAAVDPQPAVRPAAPEPESEEIPIIDLEAPSLTVPLDGTDYDVGIELNESGVVISAKPGADRQTPNAPANLPSVTATLPLAPSDPKPQPQAPPEQ